MISKKVSPLRKMRGAFGMSQTDFWKRVGVTQSGGSRYETGRKMPAPLKMLMQIAYGNDADAERVVSKLRDHLKACP